uniref:FTH domain-containing protein n=1 Tax=Rhabditophanes sp. KR3021 TaxID=114890 RepID=A0AC35TXQ6_9BILA
MTQSSKRPSAMVMALSEKDTLSSIMNNFTKLSRFGNTNVHFFNYINNATHRSSNICLHNAIIIKLEETEEVLSGSVFEMQFTSELEYYQVLESLQPEYLEIEQLLKVVIVSIDFNWETEPLLDKIANMINYVFEKKFAFKNLSILNFKGRSDRMMQLKYSDKLSDMDVVLRLNSDKIREIEFGDYLNVALHLAENHCMKGYMFRHFANLDTIKLRINGKDTNTIFDNKHLLHQFFKLISNSDESKVLKLNIIVVKQLSLTNNKVFMKLFADLGCQYNVNVSFWYSRVSTANLEKSFEIDMLERLEICLFDLTSHYLFQPSLVLLKNLSSLRLNVDNTINFSAANRKHVAIFCLLTNLKYFTIDMRNIYFRTDDREQFVKNFILSLPSSLLSFRVTNDSSYYTNWLPKIASTYSQLHSLNVKSKSTNVNLSLDPQIFMPFMNIQVLEMNCLRSTKFIFPETIRVLIIHCDTHCENINDTQVQDDARLYGIYAVQVLEETAKAIKNTRLIDIEGTKCDCHLLKNKFKCVAIKQNWKKNFLIIQLQCAKDWNLFSQMRHTNKKSNLSNFNFSQINPFDHLF